MKSIVWLSLHLTKDCTKGISATPSLCNTWDQGNRWFSGQWRIKCCCQFVGSYNFYKIEKSNDYGLHASVNTVCKAIYLGHFNIGTGEELL